MDTANKTTDQTQRLKALQDAAKLIMDDTAWIPLRYRVNSFAVRNGIVAQSDASAGFSSLGVYFWKVYQE